MENFKNYIEEGFTGFKTIKELMMDHSMIPKEKGVYLVLRNNPAAPTFLEQGTGGFFKNKNPNVAIEILNANWINGENVLYIGQAGGEKGGKSSKATLHSRIKQYLKFGNEKKCGHSGGRYIWQLEDSRELIVCWKVLKDKDPREEEKKMIQDFKLRHDGKHPFANLVD